MSKHVVAIVRGVGLFFLLAGLGRAPGEDLRKEEAPVSQAAPVTLQLKWKHQFQFAGYYAAKEKGFYRAAGLDVNLREAQAGEDPNEAVLAGRAEFGVGSSELVLLRAQGKPVVVLAAIFQHSPLILFARRDRGIGNVQDLVGKRVMLLPQEAEIFAYLRDESVRPSDLKIVPSTFNPADLIEGRVDAMSGYSTDEPFALQKAGVDFVQFLPRSSGVDFYGDCLFTTERQIREHPERVRAFREASLQGWNYALEHQEEMVDLILAKYGSSRSREQLLFEARETHRLIQHEQVGIGRMLPGRWQHIAETYARCGMAAPGASLSGFIYAEVPPPPPDLRWFYWGFAGAVAMVVLAVGTASRLFRLNRKLRQQEKLRETAEAVLRESEERYRQIFENSSAVKLVVDPESALVVNANQAAAEYYGYPLNRLVGMPVSEINQRPAGEVRDMVRAAAARTLRIFPARHRLASGEIRQVEVHTGPVRIGGKDLVFSIVVDVTERMKAEAALRESQELLQEIFDNTSAGIFIVDVLPNGRFRANRINAAEERLTGYANSAIRGKYLEEFLPPERLPVLCERYRRCAESVQAAHYEEDLLLPAGRRVRDMLLVPIRDASGRVCQIAGFDQDITERAQMEARLRESEEHYRLLVELSPDGIMLLDRDGRVTFASAHVRDLLRALPEVQLTGTSAMDWVVPEDRDKARENLEAIHAYHMLHFAHDYRIRRHDQTVVWCETTAAAVIGAQGRVTGTVILIHDISERKAFEEAQHRNLEEAERMNRLMRGREERILELKRTINGLLAAAGQPPRYASVDENDATAPSPARKEP